MCFDPVWASCCLWRCEPAVLVTAFSPCFGVAAIVAANSVLHSMAQRIVDLVPVTPTSRCAHRLGPIRAAKAADMFDSTEPNAFSVACSSCTSTELWNLTPSLHVVGVENLDLWNDALGVLWWYSATSWGAAVWNLCDRGTTSASQQLSSFEAAFSELQSPYWNPARFTESLTKASTKAKKKIAIPNKVKKGLPINRMQRPNLTAEDG